MNRLLIAVFLSLCTVVAVSAETVRVKVEANDDVDELVKNLRKQFSDRGHSLDVVIDGTHELRFYGLVETGFGGSQGTIIVLSRDCEILTAVTRSARMTKGGALNAAAKEIVKRLEAMGVFD